VTIKIEVTEKCTNQDNQKSLNPGDIVEVSEFTAASLCAGKKAGPVIEEKRKTQTVKRYEKRKRGNRRKTGSRGAR